VTEGTARSSSSVDRPGRLADGRPLGPRAADLGHLAISLGKKYICTVL